MIATATPHLIVGLGNPGPTYQATRHNAGAMVVDTLARRWGASLKSHKAQADVAAARLTIGGPAAILAKPRSYMNTSGGPTAALVRFFSIAPARLIVVHDELDLPLGTVRAKHGGGEGGHNGLKSISAALGTKDYVRLRCGIGRPPGRMNPADYVLRAFSASEHPELELMLELAADAVEMLITDGLLTTQNQINTR